MKKELLTTLPKFYDFYINQVPHEWPLIEGLEKTTNLFDSQIGVLTLKENYTYQTDKWTVKQVLQHIVDNERIMGYRALRLSRQEKINLPGYDQDIFTTNCDISKRTVLSLIEEFKLIRRSNILLLKNCTEEQLLYSGKCSGIEISALALGFVLIGHQLHHYNVLINKYLNK